MLGFGPAALPSLGSEEAVDRQQPALSFSKNQLPGQLLWHKGWGQGEALLTSWCSQGMHLSALAHQPPSALAMAFPASKPQGSCFPRATKPAAADYTGLSSSRDLGVRNKCPTPSVECLAVSAAGKRGASRIALRPTAASQSREPCLETRARLEISAAPREQGEQSGGLARRPAGPSLECSPH